MTNVVDMFGKPEANSEDFLECEQEDMPYKYEHTLNNLGDYIEYWLDKNDTNPDENPINILTYEKDSVNPEKFDPRSGLVIMENDGEIVCIFNQSMDFLVEKIFGLESDEQGDQQ